MKNITNHIEILSQMISLLESENFTDWAAALEKIKIDFEKNPREKSLELLSMYSGSGSLNDIVFYKNGKSLISENTEFAELRIRLFDICKSFI